MKDEPVTFNQMIAAYRAATLILKGEEEDDVQTVMNCCTLADATFVPDMVDLVGAIVNFEQAKKQRLDGRQIRQPFG